MTASRPWWRTAVYYEIYVRSFADADGDGVGDLEGIRRRLPYLRDLGVDALWLSPFYPSPMADHGYDVADFRDVDPRFGTLADFDRLLADAHRLGLRVTIDIVPNHSSSAHPWFQAALAAGRGAPERARYIFREGRGDAPPNNWRSAFGGPAWTRVPDGQWYLHLFDPGQPDWNWRHPDVAADYERTLRFWLDRGVDGFRVDVAMALLKDDALPDLAPDYDRHPLGHGPEDAAMWNRPEVHDVYRRWRQILDEYPGDRMTVGEIWMRDPTVIASYVRPDELHLAFNFLLLRAEWDAAEMRAAIEDSTAATAAVGAPPTWVLSSHDVIRHPTRYGGGELGERRARAAVLLLLGLPGAAYLYQGEELGLPEVNVPRDARQDPMWQRSGHTTPGRDGCRVPLPWSGDAPPYGFSPARRQPWLPQPADWARYTVERQATDPTSMLSLYRAALRHRRGFETAGFRWSSGPRDVLCWRRGDHTVVVNLGRDSVPLPAGRVVVASGPLDDGVPADTAAWLRV